VVPPRFGTIRVGRRLAGRASHALWRVLQTTLHEHVSTLAEPRSDSLAPDGHPPLRVPPKNGRKKYPFKNPCATLDPTAQRVLCFSGFGGVPYQDGLLRRPTCLTRICKKHSKTTLWGSSGPSPIRTRYVLCFSKAATATWKRDSGRLRGPQTGKPEAVLFWNFANHGQADLQSNKRPENPKKGYFQQQSGRYPFLPGRRCPVPPQSMAGPWKGELF